MIQFYRGLKSQYNYPTSLQDAIYFATDTGEILVNGVNYSTDGQKVKDVTYNGTSNILTFTKADDTTVIIDFGNKLLSDEDRTAIDRLKEALEGAGFTANYETSLDPELATITAIGGIPAGTKVSAYKDRPLSRVIDDLLFPTVQPTIEAPKATLALKSGKASIREIGSNAPVAADFTTTWNAGSIKIGSKVQATRAGDKQSDILYKTSEANVVTSEITKVVAGTTNYYYKVTYATGPTPLDSKGNTATNYVALPAGSVVSNAVAIYGVYPFFGTTTNPNITDGTVTKLPLTNSTSFTCTLAAESATSKHVIKIPHTITKFELKDPFGNWAVQPLESFVKTTENIDINGTSVTYNVYTRNQGQNGATEFRITYSK